MSKNKDDDKPCNCIKVLLEKLLEQRPTWKNKPVKQYYFAGEYINLITGQVEYVLPLNIEYEKQKKEGTTFVRMTYCPLCGKKYSK